MKYRKNLLMIIIAVVLVIALAACGQKTEEAVTGDKTNNDEKPMETSAPNDGDSVSPEEDSNEDSGDEMKEDDEMTADPDKVFTLEELSTFNGKDGQPAYIAVDGVVYDVSDVGAWSNGKHQGFDSGKDVTDQIGEISPHGLSVLESLPIVGKLAD